MSGFTRTAPADEGAADGNGAPRRRSFLKIGGATLLAGGAAASTAAARQPGMTVAATRETASTADAAQPGPPVPPDAQSLVPIPPGRVPAAVARLGSIVGGVRSRTGVPGLAVAVVHDGEVLYAKGFGVRDVNFKARVDALPPAANLGIVTLTNGMPIGIPEAINNYFLDYVEAGSVQDDWLTLYGQLFAGMYVDHSELAGKKPPVNPVPAKPDSFYIGTYDNPYYGPIRIVAEKKTLHLLIGPRPENYVLHHWPGDLFAFYPTGENAVGITAAGFSAGTSSSSAASVTLEYYNTTGLGTFTRA